MAGGLSQALPSVSRSQTSVLCPVLLTQAKQLPEVTLTQLVQPTLRMGTGHGVTWVLASTPLTPLHILTPHGSVKHWYVETSL